MFKAVKMLIKMIVFNFSFFFNLGNKLILSKEKVLEEILQGKSLLRWGDGEIQLVHSQSIHYQDSDFELSAEIMKNIFRQDSKFIVICSPNKYVCMSIYQLFKLKKLKIWLYSRYYFIKYFYLKNKKTGDAFGFREESGIQYSDIFYNNYFNGKVIHIISSNPDDKLWFSSNYNLNSVNHFRVPPVNSFSYKDSIIGYIDKEVNDSDIVLSSAGPVSKVIVQAVIKNKAQLIDTGHFFSGT